MALLEQPQLKSLTFTSEVFGNVKIAMRKLSDIGIIEELNILPGDGNDDEENVPPLKFSKLRILLWSTNAYTANFWNFFITSQMPTLDVFVHEIECEITEVGELLDEMLKFFESKPSLRKIRISINVTELEAIPFTFLCQIIEIVKEPIEERPFLRLFICPLKLREEEVSKNRMSEKRIQVDSDEE